MKNETNYEWTLETIDEWGDIVDSDFSDNVADFIGEEGHLGLVRTIGNERDGVIDRDWAYVKDNDLNTWFVNSVGKPTVPVPQRFHKQLFNAIHNVKA